MWQAPVRVLDVYTDSDWAGCVRTRKSTSGGIMKLGQHVVSHWSRTQANIALSSGEAELNGALKGACEALAVRSMCWDWNQDLSICLYGDSSASRGILQRRGFGKMKHLSVKQLWLQSYVDEEEIRVVKIPRKQNMSDLMTHQWTRGEGYEHMRNAGVRISTAK